MKRQRSISNAYLGLALFVCAAAAVVAQGASALAATSSPGAGVAGAGASQRLVPAGYGTRSDKLGNSWNFQQSGVLGRAGNSMLNTGLSLRINNQNFYNYQPMMTVDGNEYVLRHSHPQQLMGLQVTRRVRFLEKEGVVRYLEILSNPGGHDISVNLQLHSNFSGNYRTYISNEGAENFSTMGPKETSLLVVPGSASHTKAYAFSLCSANSPIKPTLTNQNKYSLVFHFNITVPAGQSVCLMHAVAQVPKPERLDRKTLAKIFKPLALSRHFKGLSPEYRNTLANYAGSSAYGGLSLLSSTGIEGLGVARARQDVLALGEQTRLLGSASCGRLVVTTRYGEVEIPFEEVAALAGGNRRRGDLARIFLRDGQVFSGKVEAQDFRFVMPSGATMNLEIQNLDRLVRARTQEEDRWGGGVGALLETYDGERISLEHAGEISLACVTPWGSMEFSLDELLWISPPEDEPVGHYLEFKDGSRFYAFLGGAPVKVRARLFGEIEIDPHEIRALVTRDFAQRQEHPREEAGAGTLQEPHLVLAGGQILVGRIAAPALHVITNAELLETSPEAIRVMRNVAGETENAVEDAPAFQIQLWGGGIVLGHLEETILEVRVRGREWRVPVQDVVEVISPQPRVSEAARSAIAKLIRELGDEDWKKRENATEELREYGYLARSLLLDAARVTHDAEVQRRLERLINAVE
ncbi:MAG: hypothetical protein ACC661_00980 [Verrucomicrobiales bacterium]